MWILELNPSSVMYSKVMNVNFPQWLPYISGAPWRRWISVAYSYCYCVKNRLSAESLADRVEVYVSTYLWGQGQKERKVGQVEEECSQKVMRFNCLLVAAFLLICLRGLLLHSRFLPPLSSLCDACIQSSFIYIVTTNHNNSGLQAGTELAPTVTNSWSS